MAGTIDPNLANRLKTYDTQGNATASTPADPATGAAGTAAGPESQAIEEGYQQFAQQQNGTPTFNQATWDQYSTQLGAAVGQSGGSLNPGVVEGAEAAEETKSDNTPGAHLVPAGTNLQFGDGSQYTVKPGDTISFEALQKYSGNPPTQTMPPPGPDNNATHPGAFQSVADPTNLLAPGNNTPPPGSSASHKNYYADINSPDNPLNPYGLYGTQAQVQMASGANPQGGASASGATPSTTSTSGTHAAAGTQAAEQ